MAKAWIENNSIFITTDKTIAPANAVDVPDNITPQDLVIEKDGTLRLKTDTEKLQDKKQELLNQLPTKTQEYILKHYPTIKQQSDISDKENAESYLALQGLDIVALRKDIANLTLTNYPDFQTALDTLLKKYNSSNQYVNYWLTQALKVAFRNYFAFLVKQEYNFMRQVIENAKTIQDLPQIEFKTQFPIGL